VEVNAKKMLLCTESCVDLEEGLVQELFLWVSTKYHKNEYKYLLVRTPSSDSHVEVSTPTPSVLF